MSTGPTGHTFLKLDAGMTDVLRPSLYGAQHPLVVVPADPAAARTAEPVVVVGHCCESGEFSMTGSRVIRFHLSRAMHAPHTLHLTPRAGDLLSCAPDEPETIVERALTAAEIGDFLVVEGAG